MRDSDPKAAYARLSGLLVGLELAGAAPYRDAQVTVIGADRVAAAYCDALAVQGADARMVDGAEMTLAGLTHARAALLEQV